jgi:hypothetical protein
MHPPAHATGADAPAPASAGRAAALLLLGVMGCATPRSNAPGPAPVAEAPSSGSSEPVSAAPAAPLTAAPDTAAAPEADAAREPEPPPTPGDLEGHVRRVQDDVEALGQPRWAVACASAADALEALSLTLRELDGEDRKVKRAARRVGSDARSLREACPGDFEAADHMRSGLETSLAGLERAMDLDEVPRLRARIELARRLVESLDPDMNWVFQRARVQDAFRTVSGAFAVAAASRLAADADSSTSEEAPAADP